MTARPRVAIVVIVIAMATSAAATLTHGQSRKPAASRATPPAAPAPPAPAPAVERRVPFAPGETLAYEISWSSFLTAATATVAVREKRPSFDSLAYYIVAEGQPTGLVAALYRVYYKVDTLLDAFTLLPQRGSIYSQESRKPKLKSTRFNRAAREASYEIQSGDPLKSESTRAFPVPADAQDALSAVYALRAIDFKTGARFLMPIVLNGDIYRLQMTVGSREQVQCGLGTLSAWRVTPVVLDERGQPDGRAMAIWFSDDAQRLPLALEAELPVGRFRLTLLRANR